MLIVSHDRYFMDALADHLFIFEGNGNIRDFNGNYTDYRQDLIEKEKAAKKLLSTPAPAPIAQASKERTKPSFKEVHEFKELEKEIPALEASVADLTSKLNGRITDHVELKKVADKIAWIGKQIDEKSARWIELSEKM